VALRAVEQVGIQAQVVRALLMVIPAVLVQVVAVAHLVTSVHNGPAVVVGVVWVY
jgi:hypothetical protein